MSGEEIRAREEFGALGGCFVEGDPEQRRREKKTKRRALALSVSLQIVALAAVILLPLLGKAERISPPSWVPMPPYHAVGERVVRRAPGPTTREHFRDVYLRLPSPNAPVRSAPLGEGPSDPIEPGLPTGPGGPVCVVGCIDIAGKNTGPTPPPSSPPPVTRRITTHLEPAMLIHRVEPVYPRLAIQVRKEGKVELRAIVGTDGTIQSLQVVSGDPFFVQSALDAVRQWRYRPTILNGQAVEVDTTISVTYTLAH